MIHFISNLRLKRKGVMFPIAMVLSLAMMALGITMGQLLVEEITFSADTYMAEKAYYNAESGIEIALLSLKNNPIQHIVNIPNSSPDVEYEMSILNRTEITDSFSFKLNKLQNQKFRLRYDNNDTDTVNIEVPIDFTLKAQAQNSSPPLRYQWRIRCQKTVGSSKKTIGLEKISTQPQINNFLSSHTGCSSDYFTGCSNEVFNTWRSTPGIDPNSCFFSLQNLSNNPTEFTISQGIMSPHKAKIIALGKSHNRSKRLVFNYDQKNMGSLFDFTFFHTQ